MKINSARRLCSGNIAGRDKLLTAARCAPEPDETALIRCPDQPERLRLVKGWLIHPLYHDFKGFDLALLQAESDFADLPNGANGAEIRAAPPLSESVLEWIRKNIDRDLQLAANFVPALALQTAPIESMESPEECLLRLTRQAACSPAPGQTEALADEIYFQCGIAAPPPLKKQMDPASCSKQQAASLTEMTALREQAWDTPCGPGIKGAPHAFGGGFVAAAARVTETAFVGPLAAVCGKAHVKGKAQIKDKAKISDNALVDGDAEISGKARVSGEARVSGWAKVSGHAEVSGKARVFGHARAGGHARVFGQAKVSSWAKISNRAAIYGEARVSGWAKVSGHAEVYGEARVSGWAKVSGHAEVYGEARVFGNAKVSGEAWVSENEKVNGHVTLDGPPSIFLGARAFFRSITSEEH